MARETVFVDAVTASTGLGVGSLTVTVVPGFPDSMNRVHVISIASTDTGGADNTVSGVTVGGAAATRLHQLTNTSNLEVWAYRNPPKGSHDVVVTFAASAVNCRVAVYELEGVDPTGATVYKLADTATGTAASDQRALTGIQGATSFLIQASSLWLATLTTSATPTAPFVSDDNVIAGASPFRVRGSASSCSGQAGPNLTPKYTYGASRAFAHAAYEFAGEPFFPQASMVGAGF